MVSERVAVEEVAMSISLEVVVGVVVDVTVGAGVAEHGLLADWV